MAPQPSSSLVLRTPPVLPAAALTDALGSDLVTREALSRINPYQPNLSGAWLLQRAMAPPLGTPPPPPAFINDLLSSNFAAMQVRAAAALVGHSAVQPSRATAQSNLQGVLGASKQVLRDMSAFGSPALLPRWLLQEAAWPNSLLLHGRVAQPSPAPLRSAPPKA